jgi:hypothetical protein
MKAKAVTGTAGVHFVAYRLSAMGYIVALTREGTPGVDLMAYSPKSGRAASIQVKTATNAAQKKGKERRKDGLLYWQLSKNALELRGKGVFYAFVDMKGCAADKPSPEEVPVVFIVPAEWVADPEHRNVPNGETALASLNVYPKDKESSSFWFDLYRKGQKKWAEKWELITDILGQPYDTSNL